MLNSDVLKKVRYILDYNDDKMIQMFKLGGLEVNREKVSNWLKREEDEDYKNPQDVEFASFLNGLIIEMRGKREGEQPAPEKNLTNNIVFRKLTIAFNIKSDEILEILALADLRVGKPELTAFFRKVGHKNYRECKAQILRNFLHGLQIKLRPKHD
jgi:uncharacterized protein YehS (DUF1456 family)